MLEGEARVFAEVFQGDQVAVSKGMAFPHVDIDAALQDWVEFQVEFVKKFLQDFVVEVVQVKDADLAFEIFYVGDDVVGAGFVDSEFVFVHSELLHHFHEGIYCEGVVLHGNTEFLLGMFFGNVFGFDSPGIPLPQGLRKFHGLSCEKALLRFPPPVHGLPKINLAVI